MAIREFEEQVREFINLPMRQAGLLTNLATWNRLCSALDVIGDTELALDAYLDRPGSSEIGEQYLVVYGVLQVLLTQQDAVRHVCNALSINLSLPRELERIREIRSNAVGHAPRQSEDNVTKSSFIHRISLTDRGFNLMTEYSDGRPYHLRYIDISALLSLQRDHLGKILQTVVEKLRRDEMAHRENHRETKLQDLFPQTLGYYFQKIYEATRGGTAFPAGGNHVGLVRECLANFRGALQKRGEWDIHDSVSYHMDLIDYPLAEIEKYFANRESAKLNEKDAFIFSSFVESQIEELRQIAKDIDDRYSSEA